VNAVIKRVKVSPAELAICGGDGSVTASSRDGVESSRFKTIEDKGTQDKGTGQLSRLRA
jgi:hypothetical protein